MQRFIDLLKTEMQKALPGTEVQWQMASSDRTLKNFTSISGNDTRVAAVLILLFPENGSIYTVFIQRPEYDGVHGGQISFPGGKQEPSDDNIIETAIRETHEEIGADPAKISVIGTLTPLFIPVSNMLVTPVIGWMKDRPVFIHKVNEVVFIFEADLKKLLDPSIVKTKPMKIRSKIIEVKYFDYQGNVIWGATAMMLHELLTIIKVSNIPIQS
ncbi:MAG: CoA pyrophosphatase [Bacteroidetes bacterium]|nr:MAG: CoA pyrophosphatase [Bacteroidota bacterium]